MTFPRSLFTSVFFSLLVAAARVLRIYIDNNICVSVDDHSWSVLIFKSFSILLCQTAWIRYKQHFPHSATHKMRSMYPLVYFLFLIILKKTIILKYPWLMILYKFSRCICHESVPSVLISYWPSCDPDSFPKSECFANHCIQHLNLTRAPCRVRLFLIRFYCENIFF